MTGSLSMFWLKLGLPERGAKAGARRLEHHSERVIIFDHVGQEWASLYLVVNSSFSLCISA